MYSSSLRRGYVEIKYFLLMYVNERFLQTKALKQGKSDFYERFLNQHSYKRKHFAVHGA